ncbi:MAG TPA: ATPase, T2SS/T4P/T4SS family [Ramlibacter sp.]|uniref:ATPase, T2SS/T4P/T4SS family n=1 Tax=Ramlibacter sp. TaxID=1917967 RepID=UPI002C0A1372|nr:ATPase, T2SS/T4P/T4SS family [Ramlibacter sp.]HVZ42782.1 ATPase, T2SS/T4P/T4SS family [Ramlibacter sp.]
MSESAQEVVAARLRDKLSRECGPAVVSALGDPKVVEIMLNPDGQIWVDRAGEGMSFTGTRMARAAAESLLTTCAAMLNTTVHYGSPILEGEFPLDGSRLQGLVPPIVRAPVFAIRKRTQKVLTLDDFRASGVIPAAREADHATDTAQAPSHVAPPPGHCASPIDAIRAAVLARRNILIVGATGSGKTTLANAVLDEVARAAPHDRLIAIEDTMELQVNVANHVLLRSSSAIDMQRLLRATMRLRPDRIVVGEVRGGEALTLLKSWNTGHPGGLATVHANSAQAGLLRLRQLIYEAPEAANLSPAAIDAMIAEAVNVVLFIQRTPGSPGRRVSEIVRVLGASGGGFEVESLIA